MSDILVQAIVAGFNRRNPESEKCHWPEDFPHDNGIYENICGQCTKHFLGHKRRPICKVCASEPKEVVDGQAQV